MLAPTRGMTAGTLTLSGKMVNQKPVKNIQSSATLIFNNHLIQENKQT